MTFLLQDPPLFQSPLHTSVLPLHTLMWSCESVAFCMFHATGVNKAPGRYKHLQAGIMA